MTRAQPESPRLKIALTALLAAESIILLLAVYFFWFPSRFPAPSLPDGIDRADYVWLLALVIPVYALRWVFAGRLWTRTPFDLWFAAFLALGLLNVAFAPYVSRGPLMLARPLLGMLIVLYLVELARQSGRMTGPLGISLVLGLIVGIVALGTTQWGAKTVDFNAITDHLPRLEIALFPGGFNPNEIAGAMAGLTPLALGCAFYPPGRWRWLWRGVALLAVSALLLALLLGQSRFAIAGVLAAGVMIAGLLVSSRWRWLGLGAVSLLILAQLIIVMDPLSTLEIAPEDATPAQRLLSERDERTIDHRLAIWRSAVAIIRDHPLTGAGMDRFRYGPVRDDYPIAGYDFPAPHTHNKFVQIAADLGLPGLIVFIGWNVTAVITLVMCWRGGDRKARVVSVAVGGALLAHIVYGLGDAIPLWDRFSFIYWLILGLAAAQFTIFKKSMESLQIENS